MGRRGGQLLRRNPRPPGARPARRGPSGRCRRPWAGPVSGRGSGLGPWGAAGRRAAGRSDCTGSRAPEAARGLPSPTPRLPARPAREAGGRPCGGSGAPAPAPVKPPTRGAAELLLRVFSLSGVSPRREEARPLTGQVKDRIRWWWFLVRSMPRFATIKLFKPSNSSFTVKEKHKK